MFCSENSFHIIAIILSMKIYFIFFYFLFINFFHTYYITNWITKSGIQSHSQQTKNVNGWTIYRTNWRLEQALMLIMLVIVSERWKNCMFLKINCSLPNKIEKRSYRKNLTQYGDTWVFFHKKFWFYDLFHFDMIQRYWLTLFLKYLIFPFF